MTLDSQDARHAALDRSTTFARILDSLGLRSKRVLDAGCGFGEYLVHFGPGSVGITTTAEEVAYGAARGIDIRAGNVEELDGSYGRFEALWANNLFEHLLSPHAFLMRARLATESDATLILGVPVIPVLPALMRLSKWHGALATNHINFFTARSLRLTVERSGWSVRDIRPYIFSNPFLDRLALPFMPHAYVVAENDAGFRYPEKKLKEWAGQPYYAWLMNLTGKNL